MKPVPRSPYSPPPETLHFNAAGRKEIHDFTSRYFKVEDRLPNAETYPHDWVDLPDLPPMPRTVEIFTSGYGNAQSPDVPETGGCDFWHDVLRVGGNKVTRILTVLWVTLTGWWIWFCLFGVTACQHGDWYSRMNSSCREHGGWEEYDPNTGTGWCRDGAFIEGVDFP